MFGRMIYNLLFGFKELVVTSDQKQLKSLLSHFEEANVAHKIFEMDTYILQAEDQMTRFYVDVHKKDIHKAKNIVLYLE
jgi:beta-galactosidase/beta-glucuronidase